MGLAVWGAGGRAVVGKVVCRDSGAMLWAQFLPQSLGSYDLGSPAGRMHSALGLQGAVCAYEEGVGWAWLERVSRTLPESRGRAHDVERGGKLCLEHLSMESPKAVS